MQSASSLFIDSTYAHQHRFESSSSLAFVPPSQLQQRQQQPHRVLQTNKDSFACFQTNAELKTAISSYVSNPEQSDAAATYGYPIGTWCVSNLTDFSAAFMPLNNLDILATFNEDISGWDMSIAVTLDSMFEGAISFNQNVSAWNLTNVVSMHRMFFGSITFNQNLCAWGGTLQVDNEVVVTDMFNYTKCPAADQDPSFLTMTGTAGPFCFACGVAVATESPVTEFSCFQTKVELELALNDYLIDNGPDTDVAAQYGWPINAWCVGEVTDFSLLFSPQTNVAKAAFNEDISAWDMRSATDVSSMFEESPFFNQDVSGWQFGKNLTSMNRMFFNAESFSQELCSWNALIEDTVDTTQLFRLTACPAASLDPPGAWCYECNRTTTSAPIKSVVPSAAPASLSPALVPANMTQVPVPTNTTQVPVPTNTTQPPAPDSGTNETGVPKELEPTSTPNTMSPEPMSSPTVPQQPAVPPASETPGSSSGACIMQTRSTTVAVMGMATLLLLVASLS